MRSATGRWVTGDDFFNREKETSILISRIKDGNHILLAGQRRMGKTSVAQEIGCRLQAQGWGYLFTDVEDATTPEDLIADIAEAVYPIQSIASRFGTAMRRFVGDNIEEISAVDFKVKIRAGLDAGSWKVRGQELLDICSEQKKPVLLVIDELPIFISRLKGQQDGLKRVEEFLSWFRRQLQLYSNGKLVVIVSGSIGLEPLVRRLGLSDRINHLEPFRLGPWSKNTSVECLQKLAKTYDIKLEEGVCEFIYDILGVGIPHHVQSFFVRLRDYQIMHECSGIGIETVNQVYSSGLLGASGQNDLAHYESRLREALDESLYAIAMQILAEAATVGAFSTEAKTVLAHLYTHILDDSLKLINDALDVLVHDGYLYKNCENYQFASNLLKDWWLARFKDHHKPLHTQPISECTE